MRGGAVPPALLFAALSCALAFTPPRTRWLGLLAVAVALLVSWLPVPSAWIEIMFIGCWASVAGTAALVHVRGVRFCPAVALAINVGAWAGATVAVTATRNALPSAVPVLALIVAAAWAVGRGWSIAVKVVSSWLIAIALLAAILPTLPTPGYAPDHME